MQDLISQFDILVSQDLMCAIVLQDAIAAERGGQVVVKAHKLALLRRMVHTGRPDLLMSEGILVGCINRNLQKLKVGRDIIYRTIDIAEVSLATETFNDPIQTEVIFYALLAASVAAPEDKWLLFIRVIRLTALFASINPRKISRTTCSRVLSKAAIMSKIYEVLLIEQLFFHHLSSILLRISILLDNFVILMMVIL